MKRTIEEKELGIERGWKISKFENPALHFGFEIKLDKYFRFDISFLHKTIVIDNFRFAR